MGIKRFCTIFLCYAILTCSIVGCGSVNNDSSTTIIEEDNSTDSLSTAKEAYKILNDSSSVVDSIGSGIIGAWGYCIEHSSKSNGFIEDLAKAANLEKDVVWNAFAEKYNTSSYSIDDYIVQGIVLSDFQTVLPILINSCYSQYITNLDTDLAEAKSKIQEIDKNETYYQGLVDYYTSINNYLEWCKSPTGSYQSAAETRTSFVNEIKSKQSTLSFDLE